MNRAITFAALLAACEPPASSDLPGVELAPQLRSHTPANACGTDIAFTDGGEIELRYRYSYDALGRLAYARGTYANSRYEDTIEYRWDNLDRMVQLVQTGSDGGRAEIVALYNTLGDLLEYTWSGPESERHLYERFDASGRPAREVATVAGSDLAFALHYDARGRLALAAAEGDGPSTIYTYDDDGRTITIDTDQGAFRNVLTYDDANRQLTEIWSGNDPSLIAGEQVFEWDGDRLLKMTYRSGSESAPDELRVVEVDSYLYDCAF
jgi:YD repeat-containing protein